jgi:pSer/pThr/pTyr-binding forkhead associated (FHA) protein
MTTFVKICPKCGHHNPEYENACSVCTHFIGMETSQAVTASPASKSQTSPSIAAPQAVARPVDSHLPSETTALYLQVLGDSQIFELRDGWILGQAHASSEAELQLRDLPGINYVHRRHCQFFFKDQAWYVRALDQREVGSDFTNPTTVNQTRIEPGQTHVLASGDQLSLANLKLVVRIV